MISIIVRTHNEEEWIDACLSKIFEQDYKDIEVIVVDDNSKDKTIELAKKYPVQIINQKYIPGKSLNEGIKASKGEFIVCLSSHCIPVNNQWLSNLLQCMNDPEIAGAYGRQEPLPNSDIFDKRDLYTTFGLDRKIQIKDDFFHNANSIIRKSVWNKIPFDEKVPNIEDRIWARQVLDNGYKLIYEPSASVYHHHGIHQGRDYKRCKGVVSIMERLRGVLKLNKKVLVIIPAKTEKLNKNLRLLAGKPLIAHTIESALNASSVDRVIVSTDSEEIAEVAMKHGAEVPFIRPAHLSEPGVYLEEVFKYTLEWLEKNQNYFPDIIVLLEPSHPFRKNGLIDDVVKLMIQKKADSVFPAKREYKSLWKKHEEETYVRVDQGFMPKKQKEPYYIGMVGLICATKPEIIKSGKRIGENIELYDIKDSCATLDVHDEFDLWLAEKVLERWKREGLNN